MTTTTDEDAYMITIEDGEAIDDGGGTDTVRDLSLPWLED